MKNKMVTAAEAVSAIKDGDVIAVGGFLGTGSPEILLDALVAQGTKHLTVIANDGGLNEENAPSNGKLKGIAKLLANHQVDHLIASHIGVNPEINRQIAAGTLTYELFPQGSLAEKLRAAGAGLGGVLTPVGLGTPMEKDWLGNEKEIIVIDGLKCDEIKTKTFKTFLDKIGATGKTLVINAEVDEKVIKSARNLAGVETTIATILNPYMVLNNSLLVVDKAALEKIEEVYA